MKSGAFLLACAVALLGCAFSQERADELQSSLETFVGLGNNHKADFISAITSGALKYLSVDYEARDFRLVAPGLVLVKGRCHAHAISGGKDETNYLSFLMAYRQEHGVWRFLAWQSCKLTASSPPYVP